MRAAYEARRLSWREPTPRTLNEKVWHRRLTDRREVLRTYCDKVATLDDVSTRVQPSLLQERLAIVRSAAELSAALAAEDVVVRVSHGSGGSVVLWNGPETRGHGDETWVRWAFDRRRIPWDRVREGLGAALERDFGWDHLEWGYLDIPRVIVVDRLYRGVDGGLPDDLLLFVFHGRVEMIRRMTDRQHDGPRQGACYDRGWNRLPVDFIAAATGAFDPPAQLGLAIEVAEELAKDEEFLRVDFLVTDSGLKLSEMTPYPLAGDGRFTTEAADRWLGSLW